MWPKGRPGPGDGKPKRDVAMTEQAELILKKKKEIEAKMAAVQKIKDSNPSEKKEKKPISLSIGKRWGFKGKKDNGTSKFSIPVSSKATDEGIGISPPVSKQQELSSGFPNHIPPPPMSHPPPTSYSQPPPMSAPYQPPTCDTSFPPPFNSFQQPPKHFGAPHRSHAPPPGLLQPPPPPPPSLDIPPPGKGGGLLTPPGPPPVQPPEWCPPPSIAQPPPPIPVPPPVSCHQPDFPPPSHSYPPPPPHLPPQSVPPPPIPPPGPAPVPPPQHNLPPGPVPGPLQEISLPSSSPLIPKAALYDPAQAEETDHPPHPRVARQASDPGLPAVVEELAQIVAVSGDELEDIARERNKNTLELGFLHDKYSALYRNYRARVIELKKGVDSQIQSTPTTEDFPPKSESSSAEPKQRKRKSRWGNQDQSVPAPVQIADAPNVGSLGGPGIALPTALGSSVSSLMAGDMSPLVAGDMSPLKTGGLTPARAANSSLLAYAQRVFGSVNLEEAQWKQCEDQLKMAALYSELAAKQVQARIQKNIGVKVGKLEYDSDEDTEDGTWEHKARLAEMAKTHADAEKQTAIMEEGRGHHIGDFLPPEELKKFMNKYKALRNSSAAVEESAFQENKLAGDNKGFKLLQKMGWNEGQGVGASAQGIVNPIGKSGSGGDRIGLGANAGEADEDDDEFDTYRKRMMLSYRFRPNPMNNPRRQYY